MTRNAAAAALGDNKWCCCVIVSQEMVHLNIKVSYLSIWNTTTNQYFCLEIFNQKILVPNLLTRLRIQRFPENNPDRPITY